MVLCDLIDSGVTDGLFFNSPGRFFAINEIKALLARIIMAYDVKFEDGKGVPHEQRMGAYRLPRSTVVLFRKRQNRM